MSPVKNIKSKRPRVFIPTVSDVYAKIIITADDATNYTILDTYGGADANNHAISARLTRTVTDRLGSFEFRIANDSGRFLDKFDGGEVIDIYADVTDATTLVFRGKIDNVEYGLNLSDGFFIDIIGRDYPEMIDRSITGIETSVPSDISLGGILYNFYNDVTLTFWTGSVWSEATYNSGNDTVSWSTDVSATYPDTTINMTYQYKKGWNVITSICERAGLDCYMEYDGSKWTLRTFVAGSVTNSDSNVAYGINLINLGEYGVDNTEVINRAIVYGKIESDNVLLLKTEDDLTSQSNLWIKDRIYNESALESMDEIQDKVDFELTNGINTDASGRVNVLCLPSLKPGDTINVTIPYCNINGTYKVHSFTHNFRNPFSTNIELSRKIKGIKDLFIPKVDADEFVGALSNPNDMKDSYTVYFNESPSIMVHTNTEENDGKLILSSGQTTGNAITVTLTTDYNVTECELRRYENMSTQNDVYSVSNNSGATWETYDASSGNTHTFQTPGSGIRIKLVLNRTASDDTSPAYESICLLYK